MANNYTLGKGELYFAQFETGTENPKGQRYLGNTPEFNLTIEEESLDHFSSDRGIREKDDSVSLQTTRTGSLITDNISPENLALYFFGSASALTVTGATVEDEEINAVEQGLFYQLGVSDENPTGHRELDLYSTGPDVNIVVTDDGEVPTTFVEGDDYVVNMTLGRIEILSGGDITDGTNLLVSYKTKTSSRTQIISGSSAIEGALTYLAVNPKGENIDYYMPRVKISPNGDIALKGEEWQQIPFSIEVLKATGKEAIYANGRAVVTI